MNKQIEQTFSRKGYQYSQIERVDNVCIYSYTAEGTDRHAGYEVVRLYVDPSGKEYFPGSTLWGIKGWTFMPSQLDTAKAKFKTVIKESKVKAAKKLK